MEIKIKNNITRILTDINRSVGDMEGSNNNDNCLCIDLLLSQIEYLTNNLNILKQIICSDNDSNPGRQKNDTEISNRIDDRQPRSNYLLQSKRESDDTISNTPQTTRVPAKKEEIPNNKVEIPVNHDTNVKLQSIDRDGNNRQALKNIISLNDKFTFVRYLFRNNITIYSEHINNIDKLGSKEEVFTYINTYLSKLYDWDNYPDKKDLFIKIVEKQFE
ncbi:MAG: hypothetical protein ACQPRH_01065 [Solitalea-like symbiont of Tyrophagus putrescentiae]